MKPIIFKVLGTLENKIGFYLTVVEGKMSSRCKEDFYDLKKFAKLLEPRNTRLDEVGIRLA